jgi:hypothetical protein
MVANGKQRVTDRQLLAWLLPLLTAMFVVAVACRKLIVGFLSAHGPAGFEIRLYNHALLVPNYADNGFIRRGLGGTIAYLLDGGSNAHSGVSLALFHLLCAMFLAVPLALLLRRLAARGDRQWPWFALFLAASPQLFWGWSSDAGRADMLVVGFIAWSLVAILDGRFWLAALVLVTGSLAHETAIIFGGPLLVGLWFVAHRRGTASLGQGATALLLLSGLLALSMIAQAAWSDDLAGIAATVHAGLGLPAIVAGVVVPLNPADFATFLNWAGPAAPRATLCGAATEKSLPFVVASSVIVLLLNFRVLGDRTLLMKGVFAFTALFPMIFISIVAVDWGRWLMFAVANAWLAAVAVRLMAVETGPPETRRDLAISLGILAVLFAMGPANFRTASMVTRMTEERVFGPWPGLSGEWLTRCDPDWHRGLEPGPA